MTASKAAPECLRKAKKARRRMARVMMITISRLYNKSSLDARVIT